MKGFAAIERNIASHVKPLNQQTNYFCFYYLLLYKHEGLTTKHK